jgi:mono/diheme cytochrome c family protein
VEKTRELVRDGDAPYREPKNSGAMKRFVKHNKTRLAVLLALAAAATSCGGDSTETAGQSAEWKRGRSVYVANCVACHNSDPAKDGPIGPALKGSPPELIRSRVLRTEYPPGYTPKRSTKIMPTFPFLESQIKYLQEYLK